MRRTPALALLGVVWLTVTLAPAAYTNRVACLRSNQTRAVDHSYYTGLAAWQRQRARVDDGVQRALDVRSAVAAQATAARLDPFDCSLPLPETR